MKESLIHLVNPSLIVYCNTRFKVGNEIMVTMSEDLVTCIKCKRAAKLDYVEIPEKKKQTRKQTH